MTQSKLNIIETPDGSATLQKANTAISYRSIKGAATESRHVFVEGSQITKKSGHWRVLELGLGTGLNLAKTVEAFLNSPKASQLTYTAIECSPLEAARFEQLGQINDPTDGLSTQLILDALQTPTKPKTVVRAQPKRIEFNLIPSKWQDHEAASLEVDAYYHDPFAPNDNPLCWTTNCFNWAKYHLGQTGILVTYSAASAIRKAMAQAGLFIAKREGACGKREMTLAAIRPELLESGKLLPTSKQPAQ